MTSPLTPTSHALPAAAFAYPALPGFANAFGPTHLPWSPAAAAAAVVSANKMAFNGYMQRFAGACC